MNLSHRSYKKELLDRDDIPFEDIRQNMKELDVINTRLGGHRITIKGFNTLLGERKEVHVCEIGCGGGDNLLALQKWCNRLHVKVRLTGIDINPSCIDFARSRSGIQECTEWIVSDYKKVSFKQKPDIIFSSLFCHHFTDEELVEQVRWMKKHSLIGFFINDLQRHRLAYQSIKTLTKFFSRSHLVKNDAPLSVARGFKKKEWEDILNQANIENYTIEWQWAFRYLIIHKNAEQQSV